MKPETFPPNLSGKRKQIALVDAIRYPDPWRESFTGRAEQFRDWRYIAMQVLHRNGGPFRLIAILDNVFDFEKCEILATDADLSREAGHCGTKTVSREIAALEKLGLIVKDVKWNDKAVNGKSVKKVRGRRIRLAIPSDVNGIHIRDL